MLPMLLEGWYLLCTANEIATPTYPRLQAPCAQTVCAANPVLAEGDAPRVDPLRDRGQAEHGNLSRCFTPRLLGLAGHHAPCGD